MVCYGTADYIMANSLDQDNEAEEDRLDALVQELLINDVDSLRSHTQGMVR